MKIYPWKTFHLFLSLTVILVFSSGHLLAQEFSPSNLDVAQEITEFEVLKRQWQNQRDSQAEMLEGIGNW